VPTLSLLVGPLPLGLSRWTQWALAQSGAPPVVSSALDGAALVGAWLDAALAELLSGSTSYDLQQRHGGSEHLVPASASAQAAADDSTPAPALPVRGPGVEEPQPAAPTNNGDPIDPFTTDVPLRGASDAGADAPPASATFLRSFSIALASA
jgi:hypothetical protein